MKKTSAAPKNAPPVAAPIPPDVFGCMVGTAEITGNIEAPVVSVRVWKAPR